MQRPVEVTHEGSTPRQHGESVASRDVRQLIDSSIAQHLDDPISVDVRVRDFYEGADVGQHVPGTPNLEWVGRAFLGRSEL